MHEIKKREAIINKMENNKIIINGSIQTAEEFKDVQGVGFSLTLTKRRTGFVSTERELINTTVLW